MVRRECWKELVVVVVGGDEIEGKIWILRKKELQRKREIEVLRCYFRGIGERIKLREYFKLQIKGKKRICFLCFRGESRIYVEGKVEDVNQEGEYGEGYR